MLISDSILSNFQVHIVSYYKILKEHIPSLYGYNSLVKDQMTIFWIIIMIDQGLKQILEDILAKEFPQNP